MLKWDSENLKGQWIQLEPLHESHQEELYDAAQNELIWTYNSSSAYQDQFQKWFDAALHKSKTNEHIPFVVRCLRDKKMVGSTRFYDIDFNHGRLAIGYTWTIPEVWGTSVNPECKLLLLKMAFEMLKVNRVEFYTDSRNTRSRAAILKLGATEEGLLRSHMVLKDGYLRNTIVFSILKTEWINIKAVLEKRINN